MATGDEHERITRFSSTRRGMLRTVAVRPTRLTPHELAGETVSVQTVLPIDELASTTPDFTPQHPTRRRLIHEYDKDDVSEIAEQVCKAVVEVVYGDRAVNQLVRCTTARVYTDIARRAAFARSRRRIAGEHSVHARLERLSFQRPNPKAIEVCGRLRRGERSHALAARLELISGRWTCVALELDKS